MNNWPACSEKEGEPVENKSMVLMINLIYSSSSFYFPFIWFLREVMFVGQYQSIFYRQLYDFFGLSRLKVNDGHSWEESEDNDSSKY